MVAVLLTSGVTHAEVVSVALRSEAGPLDTLDWRQARVRDLRAATFPPAAPLYATVELGFQEPAPRGLPVRLFVSYVQQITVVVSAGGQSRKAYLLVDEAGRGVAVEPGAAGQASVVHAEQGPVAARFGVPIWAPMPLDDHLEISIGVSTLPSFGRQLFEDLLSAAAARATGLVSGAVGEDAGQVLQKSADRALAWLQHSDTQMGRPIVLKRLPVCRESPLTCGGVLGSQAVVVTTSNESPDVFAARHEVRDGLLRSRATGERHPDFAVFVRLQVDPLPRALFSPECMAAWQDDSGKARPELAKRCPTEGLAPAHQRAFTRLRDALSRLPLDTAPREEATLRARELSVAYAESCGRGEARLPATGVPCQSVRALLERKPFAQAVALGEGLVKYREALEALAARPSGGAAVCQHEREFVERFQKASQEFVQVEPTCRFSTEDVAHPLRCGGLPGIESLAAELGSKRGALADECRQQNLCATAKQGEPALRMTLDAVCRNGVRGSLATLSMDTTPLVQVFEGAGEVKEPLDAKTAERVTANLRTLADGGVNLPATEPWSALLDSVRTRLEALTGEFLAARQFADEFAEGETAAARIAARELTELAGPVRADAFDALERTVFADLDELKRLPHPFAKLFRGGKEHFVPVAGAARELRLSRAALYRRLRQDVERVRAQRGALPAVLPQAPDSAPLPAPAG
ncbi:hypothetical protein P2318_20195 [Myxococcaceae bacterium GXIMD 01537]